MAKLKLKEVAYNYILNEIMDNNYGSNQPIVEEEISRELGMSRTPVREAINRLASEGLVVTYPDRGTFIKEVTITDIEAIWELRKLFELKALTDSIQIIPESVIYKGKNELKKLTNNLDSLHSLREADSFHQCILKYCLNLYLVKYANELEKQVERLRRIVIHTKKDYVKYIKEEHIRLWEALESRDLAKTSLLLEKHLDEVYTDIIEAYRNEQVGIV